MDIKNFVLSYYKNSEEKFHIQKAEKTIEAQKPHTHEYFQIYFIAKGSLTHYVENESANLSRGDMFIIPPGTTHYISPEKHTVFYSFSFLEDFLDDPPITNKLARNFLRSFPGEIPHSIKPKISINSEEILYVENIMVHILKEFKQKPLAYCETVQAYAQILLTMLARGYFETAAHSVSAHFESHKQFVLHCIEYIENNCTDQISLDEISKHSTMSKSNFCALFIKLTGHSFHNYLNFCRIKLATGYIKQGYKITALYGLCGYEDFSTFYRNFKKHMGISPSAYRKQFFITE